jgi:hypothetical protein
MQSVIFIIAAMKPGMRFTREKPDIWLNCRPSIQQQEEFFLKTTTTEVNPPYAFSRQTHPLIVDEDDHPKARRNSFVGVSFGL